MRSWETIWPAGLPVGVVILAIIDSVMRAIVLRRPFLAEV
jgi:hypothetical protein